MYYDFYGLKTNPFHITPDPSFFFPSSSHKEAFAALLYGLQNRKGFIAMTGEVGSGKTTVLRSFLDAGRSSGLSSLFRQVEVSKLKTVFVFNPDISFKNLLRVIYAELGIPLPDQYRLNSAAQAQKRSSDSSSSDEEVVFELVQHLHTELIKEYQAGNHILLIIDEAQNMPVRTLENLRLLSNLETARDKLLQIFLIGQPELETVLQKHELRQLRQRIAVRAKLAPLNRRETKAYIEHRLDKAGAANRSLFSSRAIRAVDSYAQGIPRRINTVCDNALISSYAAGKRRVGAKAIKTAVADIEGKPRHRRLSWALALIFLAGLLLAAAWLSPHGHRLLSPIFDSLRQFAVSSLSSLQLTGNAAPNRQAKEATPFIEGPGTAEPFFDQRKVRFPAGLFTSNQTVRTAGQDRRNRASNRDKGSTPPETAFVNGAGPPGLEPGSTEPSFPASQLERRLETELSRKIPVYSELSSARRMVLVEMAKQISVQGLLSFQRMLAALERKDFNEASRQMILSNWEERVGGTAYDLAKIMRTGNFDRER